MDSITSAGVARRQVLPVEVEPGQHPRTEVLDDDVGDGGEIGDERRDHRATPRSTDTFRFPEFCWV